MKTTSLVESYRLTFPSASPVPIVLSIPHCGIAFPDELKNEYVSRLIKAPDDTDWFVDRLYSFAPSLGITVIEAVWSRWVIDLNRDPESKPLYSDGRILTALCPVTTFSGHPLYNDSRTTVADEEVRRRKDLYFAPYHQKLGELLGELKSKFGTVLLWDCHSIRQVVPTVQQAKFPDLILGSNDGRSAHPLLIETALSQLSKGPYNLQHNHPFKGGYITRQYGNPGAHQHALQLEMTKINYMDDGENHYHPHRVEKMQKLLINALSQLSATLISLKDH